MTAMADPTPQPDQPAVTTCPWCSTTVTAGTATCPNCGAVLEGDEDTVLPGITAVDDKVLRGETKPQQRSRLLSWISGEDVEAEVANLQAEVEARRIEAVVDELEETGDEATAEAMVEAVVADDARVDAEVAALTGEPAPIPPVAPDGATDVTTADNPPA
jgi:hypothetical protein